MLIMSTKIIKCNCNSEWQDETYGPGNRVGNELKNGQFRCSVCSTVIGSQFITQPVVKKEVVKEVKPVKVVEKKVAGDKKGKKDDKPLKKPSMKGGKR